MISKISFRNTFRNSRRTALTMVAVSIAVAMLSVGNSYLQGVFNSLLEDTFKISGHLKIQNRDYLIKERMLSLTASIEDVKSLIEAVESYKTVRTATARIKFGGVLDVSKEKAEGGGRRSKFKEDAGEINASEVNVSEANISEPGVGMAIDPIQEREILKLHEKIAIGRYFRDISEDSKETIIGTKLAAQLYLKLNDEMTLITRTTYGSVGAINLKVIGISSFDNPRLDQIYYIPLAAAQKLLDMSDRATEIVVKLENRSLAKSVSQKMVNHPYIKGGYRVTTWDEATGLKEFLPIFRIILGFLVALLIFSTSFGIINTMSMAVFERIKEIGVMQAFGFKSQQILSVFLLEALLIGIIGGAIGVGIGSIFGYLLEVKGITLGEVAGKFPIPVKSKIYADLTLAILIRAYIIGIITSILATFLPAFKAARLHPTDALRSI